MPDDSHAELAVAADVGEVEHRDRRLLRDAARVPRRPATALRRRGAWRVRGAVVVTGAMKR